jgi:hypothetical protein
VEYGRDAEFIAIYPGEGVLIHHGLFPYSRRKTCLYFFELFAVHCGELGLK